MGVYISGPLNPQKGPPLSCIKLRGLIPTHLEWGFGDFGWVSYGARKFRVHPALLLGANNDAPTAPQPKGFGKGDGKGRWLASLTLPLGVCALLNLMSLGRPAKTSKILDKMYYKILFIAQLNETGT